MSKKTKVVFEMLNENPEIMPKKAHHTDACYDVFAAAEICIPPLGTMVIPSGFLIELEEGFEALMRPRSGNSIKRNMDVVLGTIDFGYTGEVGVIVHNKSADHNLFIEFGDKIAQLAIRELPEIEVTFGKIKKETLRGEKGFGSTGK